MSQRETFLIRRMAVCNKILDSAIYIVLFLATFSLADLT